MTKSAVSNAKKIATKFFGLETTPPPPLLEIFQKFIHFGADRLPLSWLFSVLWHLLNFKGVAYPLKYCVTSESHTLQYFLTEKTVKDTNSPRR